MTVTATRREESLQRVPVAVSVLRGTDMDARNLVNLQDVSEIVPALEFRTAASSKDRDIFIRGIGTTSPGVESAVSTVVDGVVLARSGQATFELLDVDRIEVLRGPQGTLFGKNASAGVINVITADPQSVTRGYAGGSYFGGGDEYRLRAGVSGSIKEDEMFGSVSAVFSHYTGNVTNQLDAPRRGSTDCHRVERFQWRVALSHASRQLLDLRRSEPASSCWKQCSQINHPQTHLIGIME